MSRSRPVSLFLLLAAGLGVSMARPAPAARSTAAPDLVGHYDGLLNPDGTAIYQPFALDVLSESAYDFRGNARIAGKAYYVVPGADGPTKFRGIVTSDGYFAGKQIRKAFQFSFYAYPTDTPGTYQGGYYVNRGRTGRWEGSITLTRRS